MGNVRSAPQPSEVYYSKGAEMLKKREQIQKINIDACSSNRLSPKVDGACIRASVTTNLENSKKSDGGQVI